MMTEMTDRQRQAEALANAQIPGLQEAEAKAAAQTETKERDVIDLSGAPVEPPSDTEIDRITTDVIKQLKTVYDPEIPTDIYELGLIYKVELENDRTLKVEMTLTAPGCPVAGEMPGWVAEAIEPVPGVKQVDVELTWEPPWGMDMMSDEARLELGFM